MEKEKKAVSESALWVLDKFISEPLEELGEILADRVAFWRYKNQIQILESAKEYAEGKSTKISPIGLKTLLPLLDAASLEEDAYLQSLWSKLLINSGAIETSQFTRNFAIAFLKAVSKSEMMVLDEAIQIRINAYQEQLDQHATTNKKLGRSASGNKPKFDPHAWTQRQILKERTGMNDAFLQQCIDSLVRFRLFKQVIRYDKDGRPGLEDRYCFTQLGWEIIRLISDPTIPGNPESNRGG